MQIGDRVTLKSAMQDEQPTQHAVVKSISDGGTVTTRYALYGRRCFTSEELVVLPRIKQEIV